MAKQNTPPAMPAIPTVAELANSARQQEAAVFAACERVAPRIDFTTSPTPVTAIEREFSPDEWLLVTHLNWHQRANGQRRSKIEELVGEAQSRLSFLRQAGTRANREAARLSLETAEERERTEAPKLRARAAELIAEAAKIENDVVLKRKTLSTMLQGVMQLRKLLPEPVKQQVHCLSHEWSVQYAVELAGLEHRANLIKSLHAMDPDDRHGSERIRLHVTRARPELIDNTTGTIRRAGWLAYLKELAEELPLVEAGIAELKTSEKAMLDACRELEEEHIP